jgi:hypothetical protein
MERRKERRSKPCERTGKTKNRRDNARFGRALTAAHTRGLLTIGTPGNCAIC